jgi:hypothetical protein
MRLYRQKRQGVETGPWHYEIKIPGRKKVRASTHTYNHAKAMAIGMSAEERLLLENAAEVPPNKRARYKKHKKIVNAILDALNHYDYLDDHERVETARMLHPSTVAFLEAARHWGEDDEAQAAVISTWTAWAEYGCPTWNVETRVQPDVQPDVQLDDVREAVREDAREVMER